MNILYITYNSALEPLSRSQSIAYLKELTKKGFKFTLLSFEKDLRDLPETESLESELKESGISWHRLAYHKKPAVISTLYDILAGVFYSISLLFKNRFDLIHARSYAPAAIACIISIFFKKKFIFDMRGMMIDEYADGGIFKKNGFFYKLGKIAEKRMLLASNATVVLTDGIRTLLNDKVFVRAGSGIEIIPCCVDLEKFRLQGQGRLRNDLGLGDRFIFVYAGSLGSWYFLEGLVDFFLTAKRLMGNPHFLCLTNSLGEANKLLGARLETGDFTVKRVSHDEISGYLSQCDAGLVFYKQSFSRLACCPVKFSEYLACGLPAILNSGIGDTESIVRDNRVGVVFNEFKDQCYEQALKQLAELKKEGEPLRKRCRSVAERLFSLDIGVSKYAGLYNKFSLTKQ